MFMSAVFLCKKEQPPEQTSKRAVESDSVLRIVVLLLHVVGDEPLHRINVRVHHLEFLGQ